MVGGIAIRKLLSHLRTRPGPLPVGSGTIAALSPAVRSAEDTLLVTVEHGELGRALTELSPQLRQALQATVIDGLTTREAARLLGIPHGTVKSRVRLAKAQLRRQMMEGLA